MLALSCVSLTRFDITSCGAMAGHAHLDFFFFFFNMVLCAVGATAGLKTRVCSRAGFYCHINIPVQKLRGV